MGMTEDSITDSVDMSLSKLREMMKNGEAWRTEIPGVTKSRHDLVNKNSNNKYVCVCVCVCVCVYMCIYTKFFINGILDM